MEDGSRTSGWSRYLSSTGGVRCDHLTPPGLGDPRTHPSMGLVDRLEIPSPTSARTPTRPSRAMGVERLVRSVASESNGISFHLRLARFGSLCKVVARDL